ncbi:HigA family addiction module antitoxin [Halomonas sp. BC2]|uniref:HigA family addiction module antitoxin n=1 Tax=Halomonas sp. BC2 TaxID=1670449 RepID=UPI001BAFC80D|nr:HigA family addiction module antitoxin [Halomonas sp. BC2]
MTMHNPPHPGEFIREVYLEPFGISSRQLASSLGVSPSTLSRLLKGESGISPEMSLRLSKVLGRSPESWLAMQDMHDLWMASIHWNLTPLDERLTWRLCLHEVAAPYQC